MKKVLLLICLSYCSLLVSQNKQLTDNYFERGEFEKALLGYQQLYQQDPSNTNLLLQLIKTHQQLKHYDAVQTLLQERLSNYTNPMLLVELGYNYQLQDSVDAANRYYNEAYLKVEENPNYVFGITHRLEDHSLLDQAIKVYKRAMVLNPNFNFNIQLAQIYGEQGNVEAMFSNYINYIETKPSFINNAKRAFSDFVSENKDNETNIILKKLLLKKIQMAPNDYWYELLSWMFVQEKDYSKSFTQEKALYKRNPESLNNIIDLAVMAHDENQDEVATEIFNFVLETTQDIDTQLLAHQYLLDIKIDRSSDTDYGQIDKNYQDLFQRYGTFEQTLSLQISYANFLAFYFKKPQEASELLKEGLTLNLLPFQEASVKMTLGDILVLQEKFNEALIYYSQIQANLKNSTLSQEARFKVAKTSYYKGDFEWAESQLNILKASTSQLIANDALDLKLLISDNKYEDTLHVALKLYAKADLMAFQNKTDDAIALLSQILNEHKGKSIEDEALLKQAKLFEKKNRYDEAVLNYQTIITNYPEDILADDALYFLAELYNNILTEPEKAKALYEQIIFKHQDSIYAVDARKKFRMLRGDAIN